MASLNGESDHSDEPEQETVEFSFVRFRTRKGVFKSWGETDVMQRVGSANPSHVSLREIWKSSPNHGRSSV